MAKSPAESTYARVVGEVAIAWNSLERRLNSIAFIYLSVDTAVGGFILGEMPNATKAEFAKFLIERFEKEPAIKEHALHAVNIINRVRENRNILEHAHPDTFGGSYDGTIHKMSKRLDLLVFDAPMPALKALVKTMRDADTYIRWIMHTITARRSTEDEPLAAALIQTLASLDKPALPGKIAPLPILEDPGAPPPRPRSSRG